MVLYLDDSGTRHPDHKLTLPKHGHDWFGMGGIIIRQSDEEAVRAQYADVRADWNITYPIHSVEIRAKSKHFAWLGKLQPDEFARFMRDLGSLATNKALTAVACVIDRPGYNHRYEGKYGRARWSLCRTAFDVVVERSVKFARRHGCKLRVRVEMADRETDARLRGYYEELRANGLPFAPDTSSKYNPLTAEDLRETLYDFKHKAKSSPMVQLADLVLWPMCIGGYDKENRPYKSLHESGTLLDCKVSPDEVASLGIKYSCWDLEAEKTKTQP